MAEPASRPKLSDPKLLREDLGKEYYEVLGVVSNYDGWLLIVKGWSVTLSLAALGLGFQQRHYAFFGIAAVTGAAFWYLDGLMKGYQYRYYVRMREIEYTAYLINRVHLRGLYEENEISAPRIDMTWTFTGFPQNKDGTEWEPERPWRQRVLQPWWRRMLGRTRKPDPCHDHPAEKPGPPDYRASEPWRRGAVGRSTGFAASFLVWQTSCFLMSLSRYRVAAVDHLRIARRARYRPLAPVSTVPTIAQRNGSMPAQASLHRHAWWAWRGDPGDAVVARQRLAGAEPVQRAGDKITCSQRPHTADR